jgi:excisionase family DNA binding protein
MAPVPDQVLRTTQVAELLGCSRQHVVHLVDRGALRSWKAGTHRRFLLSDVILYAQVHSGRMLARPLDALPLTDRRSLAYGCLIAAKLVAEPNIVMATARENLNRLQTLHGDGPAVHYLSGWQKLLDGPIEAVLCVLVSTDEQSIDLRHVGPFAGVLSDDERRLVIAATRAAA